jgi:hypothetical protein
VPAPGNNSCRRMCDRRPQGLGVEQLRVLTALPRLAVLNLEFMTWAEDAINTGPTLLAANMPHLRVLNVPYRAQVRTAMCAGVLPLSVATLSGLPVQESVKCMKSSARPPTQGTAARSLRGVTSAIAWGGRHAETFSLLTSRSLALGCRDKRQLTSQRLRATASTSYGTRQSAGCGGGHGEAWTL